MVAFVDDGAVINVPCVRGKNETKPKILFYFFLEKKTGIVPIALRI